MQGFHKFRASNQYPTKLEAKQFGPQPFNCNIARPSEMLCFSWHFNRSLGASPLQGGVRDIENQAFEDALLNSLNLSVKVEESRNIEKWLLRHHPLKLLRGAATSVLVGYAALPSLATIYCLIEHDKLTGLFERFPLTSFFSTICCTAAALALKLTGVGLAEYQSAKNRILLEGIEVNSAAGYEMLFRSVDATQFSPTRTLTNASRLSRYLASSTRKLSYRLRVASEWKALANDLRNDPVLVFEARQKCVRSIETLASILNVKSTMTVLSLAIQPGFWLVVVPGTKFLIQAAINENSAVFSIAAYHWPFIFLGFCVEGLGHAFRQAKRFEMLATITRFTQPFAQKANFIGFIWDEGWSIMSSLARLANQTIFRSKGS